MIRGLLWKAWIELWPATLLLAVLLAAAEAILAYALPTYQRDVIGSVLSQSALAQGFLKALLGTDSPISAGPELFMAFPWAHPVVLALVWAHAAIACTRSPVGEVDRGTIDLLLSQPVSRARLYCADTGAWLMTSALLLGVMFAANRVGVAFAPPEFASSARGAFITLVNLFALAWAVGGFACLVSAMSDRRGRALTLLFVALLASFLLNFLAQMWKPAARLDWLSILHYYRPVFALRDGTWPAADLAVLLGLGSAMWAVAGAVFARRSLLTS